MKLKSYVICAPGRIRTENQDNYYFNGVYRKNPTDTSVRRESADAEDYALYAVADGMGGESSGELASLIAVMALEDLKPPVSEAMLQDRLMDGNAAICRFMKENGNIRSGSTFVGLSICDTKAVMVNIGDSRAYLLREQELIQLSQDHTSVRQMVEMGVLTPEAARRHSKRHVLTQHLGIFPEEIIIEPYAASGELQQGDLFLLCSDGLHDMLEERQLHALLKEPGSVQEKGERLYDAAMQAGGRDNVTILLVSVER